MNTYGYSIPSNMFVAAGLQRALVLNSELWQDEQLGKKMGKLLADIEKGRIWMLRVY